MNEHTPGPWKCEWLVGNKRLRTGDWALFAASQEFANTWQPVFTRGGRKTEQSEADARLISAAPELLAALQELVHYDEGSSEQGSFGYEVLQRCKAAINKAEGRGE